MNINEELFMITLSLIYAKLIKLRIGHLISEVFLIVFTDCLIYIAWVLSFALSRICSIVAFFEFNKLVNVVFMNYYLD